MKTCKIFHLNFLPFLLMLKDNYIPGVETATADYEILATQVRFLIDLIKNWKVNHTESRNAITEILKNSLNKKQSASIPRELVERFIDDRVSMLRKMNPDNIADDARQTMRRMFSESGKRMTYKKPRDEPRSNLLKAIEDNLPDNLLKKHR